MASIDDSHAGADPHAIQFDPSRSPPPVPVRTLANTSIEPPVSKRIARSEWNEHESFIRLNYPRMELKELRKLILKERGFVASTQQWKKALSGWSLSKSIPKPVAKFIAKKTHDRQVREGKETCFRYRKQAVAKDKIKRYTQDYANDVLSPIGSSPSDLTYGTLKSPDVAFSIPVSQPRRTDTSMRTEFYNGQDVDGFLTISRNARVLLKQGNYPGSKLTFTEALEGLEALLSPVHKFAIDVLLDFVNAAIENKDFDEAAERLRKSYTHHQELLGDNDKKTWSIFGRLGLVYRGEKRHGQALKTFIDARRGLREVPETSPEEVFDLTNQLTYDIIEAYTSLDDFEAAEVELCDRIQQAEALGDAYRQQIAFLKHHLAHCYNNKVWQPEKGPMGVAASPKPRVETILLEAIHDCAETFSESSYYLCSLEQLRLYYETTGEVHKLSVLITERIEPILGTIRLREPAALDRYFELMRGTILSLIRLRELGKAEWWLTWRQQKMEDSRYSIGCSPFKALSNTMLHVKFHFDGNNAQLAAPLLKKAQQVAMSILPPGHPFHEIVSQMIADNAWTDQTCCDCLINPPLRSAGASRSDMVLPVMYPDNMGIFVDGII